MKNRNRYHVNHPDHLNTNENNAYQQTPYRQAGNGLYVQKSMRNRGHDPYPQHYNPQHQYYRDRNFGKGYYDSGSNNSGLFYLLIVLGFAAYGVYLLDKNYGKQTDKVTEFSIVGTPGNRTDQEPLTMPNVTDNDPQNDMDNPSDENPDVGIPEYDDNYPAPPEETTNTEQYDDEKTISSPVATLPQPRYFYIQIGVYQDYQNALKQIEKYRSQGYKAYSVHLKENTSYHHVLVGEFGSVAEAKAFNNKSGRVFEYLYSNEAFYEW